MNEFAVKEANTFLAFVRIISPCLGLYLLFSKNTKNIFQDGFIFDDHCKTLWLSSGCNLSIQNKTSACNMS